ncbi:hypothetical protein MNB_SV-12-1021 [hydrothermal vent metagenome]|uniref:Prepilin-type N-terminal cleavage/methylation domain-containing protein n=1 Tax=hydrothermal vent metagenome TaxID=652676 RepID=A0A1W1C347_9ZZZZ
MFNMKQNKNGFTLLEVLISIMLLSLVLMALYKSAEILRASNKNLFSHLERTSDTLKGSKTLYMDILQSDGNITINTDKKFHRLIIGNTQHSLYGLDKSKVTWIVYKENNTLIRVEGRKYNIPLKTEENVAVDVISENMELFKIYRGKKPENILVLLKVLGGEPQSFMVQNISLEKYQVKLVSPAMIGRQKKSHK